MATMVKLYRFSPECLLVFRVIGSDEELYVENFNNGIATIRCEEDDDAPCISAKTIAGCFDDESNFASELGKIFLNNDGTMKTDRLEAIHFKICSCRKTLVIKK